MQGIFQGFELMTHDITWAVALDLAMDKKTCISSIKDVYKILELSGSAKIILG